MAHLPTKKPSYLLPPRMIMVLVCLFATVVVAMSAFKKTTYAGNPFGIAVNKDSVESVKAFEQVYTVLMSPRCMNCHPAGEVPLQGDDSHEHTMQPKRGEDGKGLFAMKCTNCHQPENAPGLHAPPGAPNWHLPPADMKMVFEGKTARQLAIQIMDYNQNGHKTRAQLLEHAHDGLVMAGWNMGDERSEPPLSYKAFVTAWTTWLNKGGYAPAK